MADKIKGDMTPKLEDLDFIEKPIRKPDARIYGRLEKWQDSDFQQFVPVAKGTGQKREVVKSAGRAKLIKNEGEKESSYSMYVNQDANDPLFAEKMMDDVVSVLKPFMKKEIKTPTARFIHDDEAFKMWRSKERKQIVIHAELDMTLDKTLVSKEWARISYEVNKLLFSTKIKK